MDEGPPKPGIKKFNLIKHLEGIEGLPKKDRDGLIKIAESYKGSGLSDFQIFNIIKNELAEYLKGRRLDSLIGNPEALEEIRWKVGQMIREGEAEERSREEAQKGARKKTTSERFN